MKNKKILMIIAPSQFRDEELFVPRDIFTKAGYQVDIASKDVKKAKGVLGKEVSVQLSLADIRIDQYDSIVLVGGGGAEVYWDDFSLHRILKEAYNKRVILGAECIAPVILARAGLLQGKRATVWHTEGPQLQKKGALYTAENVTVDGNIVTANGPQAAEAFAQAVLKLIQEQQ